MDESVEPEAATPAGVDDADDVSPREVGVGPWDGAWPDGEQWDPELLRDGDRRNVVDRYRYWTREAIVADLDERRHPFHVAIENWEHDMNIGTVVRNANAFLAEAVHVVGRRRWNRRGAMVTDRYQHVLHHEEVDGLVRYAREHDLTVVGVDNLPGSVPIETEPLPERCLLVFGQEGPGLSEAVRAAADRVVSISQFGSTRSINAGVASGIAMHAWVRQHAVLDGGPDASSGPEADPLGRMVDEHDLAPLPEEGGFFRRTMADGRRSSILYALGGRHVSRLHRLTADEVWFHHHGDPVELLLVDDDGPRSVVLGPNFAAGQVPQALVPAGVWQGAVAHRAALVSTIVAPPYVDEMFELADIDELIERFPDAAEAIRWRS